jgi:hypothetical protein
MEHEHGTFKVDRDSAHPTSRMKQKGNALVLVPRIILPKIWAGDLELCYNCLEINQIVGGAYIFLD